MESVKGSDAKKKIVFVMGATGTGKTKLSIDLATFLSSEIINSDKMQFYKGLDIITNKLSLEERKNIPHHLLDFLDPNVDFTAQDFCHHALNAIDAIIADDVNRIPIIVGGSNSYIETLVEDKEFGLKDKFDCLFLWMDVALPVLYKRVRERVDEMVDAGLVEEVHGMFVPDADYTRGVRRSIGAPEMERYFLNEMDLDEVSKKKLLDECIEEIKDNTCKLIVNQLKKINRLGTEVGWELHRLDATKVVEKSGTWEECVLSIAIEKVKAFLKNT